MNKRSNGLKEYWLLGNSNYINCSLCGCELEIEDIFFSYVCWVCGNSILNKEDYENEIMF